MTDKKPTVAEYIDLVAAVVNLPLQPEHQAGVVANFERIQAIAQLVTEFPLSEDIEAAPVFEP
ncbi:MAG: DUF4089 domain-containing protein [Leptolyngbyaceae cyanobacterium CSU_1_3]|nr:DUF4089 domain-containing protein [Leptolyngbyaceae cyanobacterium CSU_1_3]